MRLSQHLALCAELLEKHGDMPVFFHQVHPGRPPTLVEKVVCHDGAVNCGLGLYGLEHVCIGDREGVEDEGADA